MVRHVCDMSHRRRGFQGKCRDMSRHFYLFILGRCPRECRDILIRGKKHPLSSSHPSYSLFVPCKNGCHGILLLATEGDLLGRDAAPVLLSRHNGHVPPDHRVVGIALGGEGHHTRGHEGRRQISRGRGFAAFQNIRRGAKVFARK